MRLPLVCLTLATLACGDSTPFDTLATSVTLSKPMVEVNDTLTVALTLKNEGGETVSFTSPTPCFLVFQVTTAAGASRGVYSAPCAAVIEEVTLAPGEVREVSVPWNLSIGEGDLGPGEYLVRGGIEVVGTAELQALSEPAPLQVIVH